MSLLREVASERALLLTGGHALLLQIAHPSVAAAVEEHSDFYADPLGRGHRTITATHRLCFGSTLDAERAGAEIVARHRSVVGTIGGHPYHANDPELLLWVHLTLVANALLAFETFVRTLSAAERDALVVESNRLAILVGVPPQLVPQNFSAFLVAYADGLSKLDVREPARRQCRHLLSLPASVLLGGAGVTSPLLLGLADLAFVGNSLEYIARLLVLGFLPPRIREAYDEPWSIADRIAHAALVGALRAAYRHLPRSVRQHSESRPPACPRGGV